MDLGDLGWLGKYVAERVLKACGDGWEPGLADVSAEAFRAWWHGAGRAQATAALQAMGFRAEDCGVAMEAAHGSIELACELLVDAAKHETEPAARGAGDTPRRRSTRRTAAGDHELEYEIAAPRPVPRYRCLVTQVIRLCVCFCTELDSYNGIKLSDVPRPLTLNISNNGVTVSGS